MPFTPPLKERSPEAEVERSNGHTPSARAPHGGTGGYDDSLDRCHVAMAAAVEMPVSDTSFVDTSFGSAGSGGGASGGEVPVTAKLRSAALTGVGVAQGFLRNSKSWVAFFDVRRFSKPVGVGDASTRIQGNWKQFRANYIICLSLITLVMLLRQPYSFTVVLVLSLVWSWVFFLRPNAGGPLKLFGKEYAPTEQGITLGIATFLLVFFFTSAASTIFFSLITGLSFVALHGSFRLVDTDAFAGDDVEAGGTGSGMSYSAVSTGIEMGKVLDRISGMMKTTTGTSAT